MPEVDEDVHVPGFQWQSLKVNGKRSGAEIRPAIVSGIVTGDVPVSYWLIFFQSLVTVPGVFAQKC